MNDSFAFCIRKVLVQGSKVRPSCFTLGFKKYDQNFAQVMTIPSI